MHKNIPALVVLAALALAGCASSAPVERTTTTNQPSPDMGASPYGSDGIASDSIAGGTAVIGGATSPAAAAAVAAVMAERSLTSNVVYFEFVSSAITAEGEAVVSQYASYLKNSPVSKVRLEGHADERGTREYNVGLGERRANAVESALLAQGVTRGQISVGSYGEERPADPGHTEESWAKNRRVQIIRQ